MTFYFVYNKEYIVDRNKYMKKYTNNKNKNILKGSPILVNIEGSYVYLDSLQYMLHHKSEKYKRFLFEWIRDVRNAAPPKEKLLCINLKWSRQ